LRTLFLAVRAALWATGFVLFWAYLAVEARRLDSRIPVSLPAGLVPFGYLLFAAGAALTFACLGFFVVRGRGTAAPFDPPRVFVPTGPYRYIRNPMYLGAALLLAGAGLAGRSPGILALSLALLATMHLFVILIEEPGLEKRFGETYERYKRAVHRWIPRRPPRAS
jgi:protein-S-isoprenylcysteine O-methyltransferase Ste14